MTTPAPSSPFKIGIIICSTRIPRVCPQIASFVISTLTPLLTPTSLDLTNPGPIATLCLIDLAEINLPMYNEPTVPSRVKHWSGYVQPHTQAWSKLVSSYDGFIFVTPQYNWGYPASVKNAIDYLFNEWKSKPTLIISYGGHGGDKAAAQLRFVLESGIGMSVVPTMPALAFPSREVTGRATRGEDIGLGNGDGDRDGEGFWVKEGEEVRRGWGEMVGLLEGLGKEVKEGELGGGGMGV